MNSFTKSSLITLSLLALGGSPIWAAHPSRGLWVGEVALNAVNEATGAVGDSNTYEFTDPETVTPTSDTAYLRLILHVNAAGQASLLKSVAIVDRSAEDASQTDLLLITDPTLYSQYPGIAKRIASAAFDFGNQQAVIAVQKLVDDATAIAVSGALAGDDHATIQSDIEDALEILVDDADVDSAYLNTGVSANSFITDNFFNYSQVVDLANAVATLLDDGSKTAADFAYDAGAANYTPFAGAPFAFDFDTVFQAAEALRDGSFYGDTRAIQAIVNLVADVVVAVESSEPAADLAVKQANALAAAEAAWHNAADVDQAYNRFLASDEFSKLPSVVITVAVPAAIDAEALGGDATVIATAVRDALLLNGDVGAATTAAGLVALGSVFSEEDPRPLRAIETVIESAVASATAQVLLNPSLGTMATVVGEAVDAAFVSVPGGATFLSAPTESYTNFVSSSDYTDAAVAAAVTATTEALFQLNAGVDDEAALIYLTQSKVNKALVAVRNDVAALSQYVIPFSGSLVDGESVQGTLHLPALAPTNPFLHRLHPDHSEGFPIVREIQLTVDNGLLEQNFALTGLGVSQLTGVYEEEIFGLHKPLGPSQDVGLKTQGIFTLNRLSLIDTLNF
ncbi:hypothetical protein ACWPKO_02175 [Coraliomargarita sp. W4R53]